MAEQLTVKWLASNIAATVLWMVPIPLRVNPAVTTFALLGSIGGYSYAYFVGSPLEKQWKLSRKLTMKEEKLENYQFALSERAEKTELEHLFGFSNPVNSASSESSSESNSELQGGRDSARVSAFSESPESTETRSSDSESPESPESPESKLLYTIYGLKKEDAQKIVKQAVTDGMNKNSILEVFWEVKPGGSRAYKVASKQYDDLLS